MGEYLQIVANDLTEDQLRSLVATELAECPGLAEQLDITGNTISTKLATCEHVFFTFEEIVALSQLVRKHTGVLSYGLRHEYNETPEDILMDRSSLYLGPHDQARPRAHGHLVPADVAPRVQHSRVWRKTKRTLSRNGRWYQRKVRRDETSGVPGNRNGYQTDCRFAARTFRANREGFAWDASTNRGRKIYSCPCCHALFNLGEAPTPHLADLAAQLTERQALAGGPTPGMPGAAAERERLPATSAPGAVVPHE